MYRPAMMVIGALAVAAPAAAMADTPRELLTVAAFQTSAKPRALALVTQAVAASDEILAAHAGDHEATLQRGVAIGYRAKLTRSQSDAKASLAIFQKLAARNPGDAEAQMAIAGWHLDAVEQLGSLLARAGLGARTQAGDAALVRAVALGGDRAFFPGLAALMRIRNDPGDVAQARKWAQAAVDAGAPTPLDALMKRAAASILPALRANDGKAAAAQARKLLPFGKLVS